MSDLTTLEDLAPWPGMNGEVTAEGLTRYYAVRALQAAARAHSLPEGAEQHLVRHIAADEGVIALLLLALIRHAPDDADRIAGLVRDLLETDGLISSVADQLRARGIDPGAFTTQPATEDHCWRVCIGGGYIPGHYSEDTARRAARIIGSNDVVRLSEPCGQDCPDRR